MNFTVVDIENWKRGEHFDHYLNFVPCTYSASFKLDISNIRRQEAKLYPAMLFSISKIVNMHQEFRMALNTSRQLGYYDITHPCYTVFHKASETFSNIWTEFSPNYQNFFKHFQEDMLNYGHIDSMIGKPDIPLNHFNVSMVPWASFEGFNLNLQKGFDYLSPIFTLGKFYNEQNKTLMPIAIQVHHAVCDGFHLCRFVNELQELIDTGDFSA